MNRITEAQLAERKQLSNALKFVTTTDTPRLAEAIHQRLVTCQELNLDVESTLRQLEIELREFHAEVATATKYGDYRYRKVHLTERQQKCLMAWFEFTLSSGLKVSPYEA